MATTEALLRRAIHRFDIYSLLALLKFMGYRMDQVRFGSHHAISSQPCLLQDIEFRKDPVPQVTIFVNLGLLSVQSPLPSYFSKRLERGDADTSLFLSFIGFFDHQLLNGYFANIYPETNTVLFPDWEKAKRRYLLMLSLRSSGSLEWLLRLAVPELGVRVEKAAMKRSLHSEHIRLGKSALGGDAVFGQRSSVPVYGLRVTFFSDEDYTGSGEPWPREVRKRLDRLVFPVLRMVGTDLEIFLVIRAGKSWARLHRGSYLGYDIMRSGKEQYRRVPIFSGYLSDRDDGTGPDQCGHWPDG